MLLEGIVLFLAMCLTKYVSSGNLCLSVQFTVILADQKADSYLSLPTITVDSRADCASSCGVNWECVSFFHNPTTDECRLYSGKISALNLNPETGWTGYEMKAYDLCYKVHTNKMTWNQARAVCQGEGAEMVILNTPAKKARIEDIVSQDGVNEYFLGAKNDVTEGEWRWVADNALISWFSKVGEDSDCFEIQANLAYDDTGCNQKQKFICKKYL